MSFVAPGTTSPFQSPNARQPGVPRSPRPCLHCSLLQMRCLIGGAMGFMSCFQLNFTEGTSGLTGVQRRNHRPNWEALAQHAGNRRTGASALSRAGSLGPSLPLPFGEGGPWNTRWESKWHLNERRSGKEHVENGGLKKVSIVKGFCCQNYCVQLKMPSTFLKTQKQPLLACAKIIFTRRVSASLRPRFF